MPRLGRGSGAAENSLGAPLFETNLQQTESPEAVTGSVQHKSERDWTVAFPITQQSTEVAIPSTTPPRAALLEYAAGMITAALGTQRDGSCGADVP